MAMAPLKLSSALALAQLLPEAELRILHGDFLLITTGAANKLGMPRFDAAFDRGAPLPLP